MLNRNDASDLAQLLGLLPHYQSPKERFDELLCAKSGHLASWNQILVGSALDEESDDPSESVRERWNRAKKNLVEITGMPSEGDVRRNSEVDPIPLIFPASDWEVLADGVAQRARLLDHILKDVYGPQTLLTRGLLPPELVFGHDGYLPAMRGSVAPDRSMLTLYAAQLYRDPSGRWLVMADRTQGPSGGGYSVENRIAISAVLPREFREMMVHRAAPFFAALRDSMNRNAIAYGREDSTMVLLSPGVHSSAYFEDAYLARYLGYTIAQGEDLTVRGGGVFIKTLTGLKRVSNILRRMRDNDCDPLELVANSAGVPGLCQAARDRQVSIENQLGSGWAEQPALQKFLPKICEAVFNEQLKLPSVATYWCGDDEDYQFVLANKEQLVLRSAFAKERERDIPAVFSKLGAIERKRISTSLARDPWKWVATPAPQCSTAPCWNDDNVVAWPFVLRVFATAIDSKFQVLSSGIARVGPASERLTDSLNSGLMSKDVWVLGDSPVAPTTLRQKPKTSFELRRSTFDLPSRVAEQMHWLGRWTARSEGIVRHVRFCANRLSAERESENLPALSQVIAAIEGKPLFSESPTSLKDLYDLLCDRLVKICFNAGDSSLLPNALVGVVRNASCLRDRLSRDSWLILSRMDIESVFDGDEPQFPDVAPALNQLLNQLTAFAGLASESMTRGPGWHFLQIGRRVENLLYQVQLIESLVVPVLPRLGAILEALLEIMDSAITYRYRYLMNLEIEPVLDLLLLDPTNPRSMLYQFVQLDEHLDALTPLDIDGLSEQRANLQECQNFMQLLDMRDLTFATALRKSSQSLTENEAYEIRHELGRLMTAVSTALGGMADYLTNRFFTHTSAVQLGAVTKP